MLAAVHTADWWFYFTTGTATGLVLGAFRTLPHLRRRLRRRDQLEDIFVGREAAPGIPAVPGLGERLDTTISKLDGLYDYSHDWRHGQANEIAKLMMTLHLLIHILEESTLDERSKGLIRQLPKPKEVE